MLNRNVYGYSLLHSDIGTSTAQVIIYCHCWHGDRIDGSQVGCAAVNTKSRSDSIAKRGITCHCQINSRQKTIGPAARDLDGDRLKIAPIICFLILWLGCMPDSSAAQPVLSLFLHERAASLA